MPAEFDNPRLKRVYHELRASGAKDQDRNHLLTGIHTRGYLPHVKREGADYFVTFRLADSLPKEVLLRFEAERAKRVRDLALVKRLNLDADDSEEKINRDF